MPEKSFLDKLLVSVKIVAVVAAGAWTLVEYFDYKRQLNELTVELKKVDVASHNTDALLKQIEARFAERLANENLASQEMNNILKTIEVKKAEDTRAQVLTRLKIAKPNASGVKGVYEAAFGLSMVNKSDKPLTLSYIVIDYFLRSVETELAKNDRAATRVFRIASPPHVFTEPSSVQSPWQHVGYEAHILKQYSASLSTMEPAALKDYKFEIGGGGTGTWASGSTIDFEYPYFVEARKGDMVGFSVGMCLNGGTSEERHVYDSQFERLR